MYGTKKRIISLNLAVLMLLTMLPLNAVKAAEPDSYAGYYAYCNTRGTAVVGEPSYYKTLALTNNLANYSLPGYQFCGWSLTPGGMPVTAAEDVPSPASEPVPLYICWKKVTNYASAGELYLYHYTGPTRVGEEILLPSAGEQSGAGWRWDGLILTLTEAYAGGPILASEGIGIRAEGTASVFSPTGPAVEALNGSAALIRGGTLHITSGDDAAVKAADGVRMSLGTNVTLSGGPACRAISAGGSVSLTAAAENDPYTVYNDVLAGADEQSAADTTYSGQRWLRVTPPRITYTFDPNGGSFAGGGTEPVSFTDDFGKPLASLPAVTNGTETFMGWSTNQNGAYADSYYALEDLTGKQSRTLYAIWQQFPAEYVLLDAGTKNLGSEFDYRPRWAWELKDGKIELPAVSGSPGWYTQPLTIDWRTPRDDLYWAGVAYELESGSTLYAAFPQYGEYTIFHGNGGTLSGGGDRMVVAEGTHSDLKRYAQQFTRAGQVALDFNTRADGSGENALTWPRATDLYAQWVDAPAGSVVLYAAWQNDMVEGRGGRVLTGSQVENFDITDPNGFVWPGHKLTGWSADGTNILQQLPEPDSQGRYIMKAMWRALEVRLETGGYPDTVWASPEGEVHLPYFVAFNTGKTLNGWNTAQDGSGTWYRPGTAFVPTEDMTLYAQFLDTPYDSGTWVLVERQEAGGGRFRLYTGSDLTDNGDGTVTLTLPEGEDYYYCRRYGYMPGAVITVANHATVSLSFSDPSIRAHANGGAYPDGAVIRVVATFTDLTPTPTLPTGAEFVSVPDGATLGGWSPDQTPTESSVIYEPGAAWTVCDTRKAPLLYAVWDGADTAYVTLQDGEETTQLRCTAGEVITLPVYNKLGYTFDGWSDGEKTYPGGSSYTVPRGGAALSAQWTERTMLVVDGVSYDPNVDHDYSDSAGWKWVSYGSLYLSGYSGGAIYLPRDSYIYIKNSADVTAAAGETAVICNGYLYIYSQAESGRTVITGGAGAPAVYSKSLYLYDESRSYETLELRGGAGAPAVKAEDSVWLDHARLVLQGGDAAAIAGNYVSLSTSSFDYYAGADQAAAVQVTQYSGETYLHTEPQYVTLTLDGRGGKAGGREMQVLKLEREKYFDLSPYALWRPGYEEQGWNTSADGSGRHYSDDERSYCGYEDAVLYAQWKKQPEGRYLTLDAGSNRLVQGQQVIDIAVPESGIVTLPAASSTDGTVFGGWHCSVAMNNGAFREKVFPAGVEVDVSALPSGTRLGANFWSVDEGEKPLWINWGSGVWRLRWSWGDSGITLDAWNAPVDEERFPDFWTTNPDGSGTRYNGGDTFTFAPGEDMAYLYTQYKPTPTYTTRVDNERLPGVEYEDSMVGYMEMSCCWRDAAWSNLYPSNKACGLPAGTTLYAVNRSGSDYLLLDGNGAADPMPLQFAVVGYGSYKEGVGQPIMLEISGNEFARPGYRFVGWNTRADGKGAAYPAEYSVVIGAFKEVSDQWGTDFDEVMDEAALTALPKRLYAQWEQIPVQEIPVPVDMLEEENAAVLCGLYSAEGKLLKLIPVTGDTVELFAEPADGTYYRFFCADGTTWHPRLEKEEGAL